MMTRSGNSRMLIAAAAVGVAAVIILSAVIIHESGSGRLAGPAGNGSRIPAGQSAAAGAVSPARNPVARPHGSGASNSDLEAEASLGDALEKQTETAAPALTAVTVEQIQKNLWLKEDATLAREQTYGDVAGDYRKRAADLLKSLGSYTTKDVLDLEAKLSEEFWSAGSLAEPAAYEHAYLARAIAETALDADPGNYQLLTALRDAVSLTAPLCMADGTRNDAAYATMWPILEKQRQMILSGQSPAGVDAMLAMYDWLDMATTLKKDIGNRTAAWKWLVDNADSGGWAQLKPSFAQGLKFSQSGGGLAVTLYCMNGTTGTQEQRSQWAAQHARLLPSHPGSQRWRECSPGAWQPEASKAKFRTVLYDPVAGKQVDAGGK